MYVRWCAKLTHTRTVYCTLYSIGRANNNVKPRYSSIGVLLSMKWVGSDKSKIRKVLIHQTFKRGTEWRDRNSVK